MAPVADYTTGVRSSYLVQERLKVANNFFGANIFGMSAIIYPILIMRKIPEIDLQMVTP